ncbi:MAG TPA: hypothetical protein P5262_03065 [Candidatus Moranbacteria bacterium]|nr:hypothetical protein [Candidatus Moranbacteria bacterium]
MDIKQKIHNHSFLYILVALVFMAGVFSYYRFMTKQDYLVGYEGACDLAVNGNKCFAGCSDDACTEKYYYSKMVKYSPDLYKECGEDITDCEAASSCLLGDHDCSKTYCDPEVDGDACATEVDIQNNKDSTEEESPQNNEINNDNL